MRKLLLTLVLMAAPSVVVAQVTVFPATGTADPAQFSSPDGSIVFGGVIGTVTAAVDSSDIGHFSFGTDTVSGNCIMGDTYHETDAELWSICIATNVWRTLSNAVATILPNTGTASTSLTQSGYVFTNTGDADGSALNLLDNPTAGVAHSVVVTVAQTITVAPASGETLYLNAAACANVTSATVGAALSVVAVTGGSGGIWVASGAGWTCN